MIDGSEARESGETSTEHATPPKRCSSHWLFYTGYARSLPGPLNPAGRFKTGLSSRINTAETSDLTRRSPRVRDIYALLRRLIGLLMDRALPLVCLILAGLSWLVLNPPTCDEPPCLHSQRGNPYCLLGACLWHCSSKKSGDLYIVIMSVSSSRDARCTENRLFWHCPSKGFFVI